MILVHLLLLLGTAQRNNRPQWWAMRWPVDCYSLGLCQTKDCSPRSPHWKPELLPLAFSLPAILPESSSQQVAEPLETAPNALWLSLVAGSIGEDWSLLDTLVVWPRLLPFESGLRSTWVVRWYPGVSHPGLSSWPV